MERNVRDRWVLRCGTDFQSQNNKQKAMYAIISVKFNIPNSSFLNEFDPTTIYYRIYWDYHKIIRSISVLSFNIFTWKSLCCTIQNWLSTTKRVKFLGHLRQQTHQLNIFTLLIFIYQMQWLQITALCESWVVIVCTWWSPLYL